MKLRKLISLLLAAVMLLGAVAFAEPAKIVATDYTGKTIILQEGDSIYFDSTQPHGMMARGNKEVKFFAFTVE